MYKQELNPTSNQHCLVQQAGTTYANHEELFELTLCIIYIYILIINDKCITINLTFLPFDGGYWSTFNHEVFFSFDVYFVAVSEMTLPTTTTSLLGILAIHFNQSAKSKII